MSEVPSAASRVTEQEALDYHRRGQPGKIEIMPTKPLTTQQDLSLAYSPGVAYPCLSIERDPACAYDYTAKGNMVAVITNGTAVLGLGDLGALAAKPVMEGKAVLFKRFAGIDSVDLEIATRDVDEFVNCVRFLHPAFGGINLEDIKAPECFPSSRQRLRELMDIPVFRDDQHGTAIITTAALLNALDLTGRDLAKAKIVVNGAGAAAIACIELVKTMGLPHGNIIMCDTKGGEIYEGRRDGMNQWKSALHAVATHAARALPRCSTARTSSSVSRSKARCRRTWCAPWPTSRSSPPWPIPIRRSRPEDVRRRARRRHHLHRPLGLSESGQQCFGIPLHLPRRARRCARLDDQRRDEDRGGACAGARLAREDVPDEVAAAYAGQRLSATAPTTSCRRRSIRASIWSWSRRRVAKGAAMEFSAASQRPFADLIGLPQQPEGSARSHRGQSPAYLRAGGDARARAASSLPRAKRKRRSARRSPSATTATARR